MGAPEPPETSEVEDVGEEEVDAEEDDAIDNAAQKGAAKKRYGPVRSR